MQHTVFAGQQFTPHDCWHSQMPASGPAPQQYPLVASNRVNGCGQHFPPEQLVPDGQVLPSSQQLAPSGTH